MGECATCVIASLLAACFQETGEPQSVIKVGEAVSTLGIPPGVAETAAIGTVRGAIWVFRKGVLRKLERLDRRFSGQAGFDTEVETICFAPTESKWLASSNFARATLWDLQKAREVGSILLPEKLGPRVFPYVKNGDLTFLLGGQNSANHNESPSLYRLRVDEWEKIAALQFDRGIESRREAKAMMSSNALPEAGSVRSIVKQPATDSIVVVGRSFSDPRSLGARERIQKPWVRPYSCRGGDLEVLNKKPGGARSFISSLRLGDKGLVFEYWHRESEYCIGAISESNGAVLACVVRGEGDRMFHCERLSIDERKRNVEASELWCRGLNEKEYAEVHGSMVVLRSPKKLELLSSTSGKRRGSIHVGEQQGNITCCAVDEGSRTIWIGLDSGEVARGIIGK